MDELTSTIQKCNIQLKLDNNTEGYGNCFPNAILQQCRRPEIQAWLQKNKPWAIVSNHRTLRKNIKHFALNSPHKTLQDYKINYERIVQQQDNTSWTDYWAEMGQVGTWVDSVFVQVSAWYMGLDIQILTTSAKPENPFLIITGNINTANASSSGPPLLLGNYTNVHYQSLLPVSMSMKVQHKPRTRTSVRQTGIIDNETRDDFIFMHNGQQIIFPNLESERLQCPFCSESFLRPHFHQ